MIMRPKPVEVNPRCLFEEGRQLGQGSAFLELSHLAGVEVQIGQLDGDVLQGVGLGIDKPVDLGLGPMQRVGCPVPAALDRLDLLQQHVLRADEQTINPALNAEDELGRFDLMAEPHLFLIAGGAGTLEPLVAACARQGPVPPYEIARAAKVALRQRELDELAHLDREDWL